jgi:hypothetical protein
MRNRMILHTLWIASAVAMLVPSIADPDLWGHLLFGSSLLGGSLPLENGFAYTTPTQPWLNHELLAEAVMAGCYHLAGPAGLVALKVAVGLATAAMLWRSARRRSGDGIATAAVVLALFVMRPGFMIRPQIFTMLFLAVVLDALAESRQRAAGRLWCLPLLVAVWVNVHGGVLAGVGLVAVGIAAARAAELARGALTVRATVSSAVLLLLMGLALLANPYGVGLVRFLVTDVTPQVPITEWAPVALTDPSFAAFEVMVLVAAAGVILARPSLAETVIVAAAAVAAFRHQRHVPLFAIAAAPLVAATLAAAVRRWPAGAESRLPALVRFAITGAAAMQLVFATVITAAWRGDVAVNPHRYPIQAVRFLAQNDIVGNVAAPFDWGEYALWALPAGSRIAIDGRFTTAYPADVIADAWRFMSGGRGWDALLTRYPTDIVVAARTQAPARLLAGHPEWEYVYSDPVTVVFVRRSERNAATLERFHAGQLVYDRSAFPTTYPASDWAEPVSAVRAQIAANATAGPDGF